MANETARPGDGARDLAGSIAAAVFILIGAAAWWDTTSMADPDSYVFPRTVIALLVGFSLLLILRNLLRGGDPHYLSTDGSWPRRIGLVAVMLGGALAMPVIGFLPAGIIVFLAIMLLAMYDPWQGARRLVFPLVGIAIVVAFFALFAEVLRVPLPVGSLFE